MAKDYKAKYAQLLINAASERALGNHAAAASYEAKAEKLRLKHDLPRIEPLSVPRERNYDWTDFPGVPPQHKPLTNEQLNSLRARCTLARGTVSHIDKTPLNAEQRAALQEQAAVPVLADQSFTPFETDDRGAPYSKPSEGGKSWLSKFQFWN